MSPFRRELQALPLPAPVAATVPWLPVAAVLVFAWLLMLADTHRETTYVLVEGGPVEIVTFLGFLAAAVLGIPLVRRARRAGLQPWAVRFYVVFAVIAFIAAMEEISWGQSFLDYSTPAAIRSLNQQGEFNLHNLPGIDDLNSLVVPLFGVIGLVLSWPWKRPWLAAIRPPLLLLPSFVTVAVAGTAAFLADWWVANFSLNMVLIWLTEVVEMVMGLACFLYIAWKLRTIGAAGPGSDHAGSGS